MSRLRSRLFERSTSSPELGERRRFITPARALAAIAVVFTGLTLIVAVATPPWEANDEPDHVVNVETILSGKLYRIETSAGLEAAQAPLYYAGLALWQKALYIAPHRPFPSYGSPPGLYKHDTPTDSADQRLVSLLRLPSVFLGLATILLTFAAARRIARDPWTPVVAAAIVAMVPRFVFLSGVINNDNLNNALAALATFLAIAITVTPAETRRRRIMRAATLGLVFGLLLMAKETSAVLAPALLLALLFSARERREAGLLLGAFSVIAFAVSGWWFVRNQIIYGDFLSVRTNINYLRGMLPDLVNHHPSFHRALVNTPRELWHSFWYTSGWNQFRWADRYYAPFWLLTLVGLAGVAGAWGRDRLDSALRRTLIVLSLFFVGGLSTLWIIGLHTVGTPGRWAFIGLPALAILVAVGFERLRIPLALKLLLPLIGFYGTVHAIHADIIGVFGT